MDLPLKNTCAESDKIRNARIHFSVLQTN